jgi:ABC-type sugar transport system ATPase subunit
MLLLTAAQMKKSPVLIIDSIAKGISLEDQKKIRAILQDFRTKDITIFSFSSDDSYIVYYPDEIKTFVCENGEYRAN